MADKVKDISVSLINMKGQSVSDLSLKGNVFGIKVNDHAMYTAVKTYMGNCRQATAKTKTRSEVSGGGKKPWRQKGTGRARSGSTRSVIWVGGGRANTPMGTQNYTRKQNKREHDLALRSALTLKAQKGLVALDKFDWKSSKTKDFSKFIKDIKVNDGKTLIVLNEVNDNLRLASKNISKVAVVTLDKLSVYDLLDAKYLVSDKETLNKIEEVLA